MKKPASLILICILISGLLGCSPERAALNNLEDKEGLLWSRSDFKKTDKELEEDSTIKIDMQGSGRKTPYSKNGSSLNYAVYGYFNQESNSFVDLAWDVGVFRNIFFYENEERLTIAKGAQTFSKSGRLLAEARLLRFLDPDQKPNRFEIEERHYGPEGNLIFTCKSQFDDLGAKVGQSEEEGKKAEEYYFIWAVGF
jgi:hypothetical protein